VIEKIAEPPLFGVGPERSKKTGQTAVDFDNIVRDFDVRYVEGYTSTNFADVVANAPFSE
jgi:hypothetical protein